MKGGEDGEVYRNRCGDCRELENPRGLAGQILGEAWSRVPELLHT